jgi:hypothetical protein
MVYREEDLKIVDALAWVRSSPARFFGRDAPYVLGLLPYLVADVLDLGPGECVVRRAEGWWLVGSDAEWLAHDKYSIPELFTHVVPAPAHGEHSMRGEVLLGAFAADVAVKSNDALLQIQGQAPPAEALKKTTGLIQAILFRL